MSDPKSYTDIGGGGPYPPHGEDFFDRIVNVHWPQRGRGPLAFLYSDSGGMFGSIDGKDWKKAPSSVPATSLVWADGVWLASNKDIGCWISSDGANTWEAINAPAFEEVAAAELRIVDTEGTTAKRGVFAGWVDGDDRADVYTSYDHGKSWGKVLTIEYTIPGGVFVGEGDGSEGVNGLSGCGDALFVATQRDEGGWDNGSAWIYISTDGYGFSKNMLFGPGTHPDLNDIANFGKPSKGYGGGYVGFDSKSGQYIATGYRSFGVPTGSDEHGQTGYRDDSLIYGSPSGAGEGSVIVTHHQESRPIGVQIDVLSGPFGCAAGDGAFVLGGLFIHDFGGSSTYDMNVYPSGQTLVTGPEGGAVRSFCFKADPPNRGIFACVAYSPAGGPGGCYISKGGGFGLAVPGSGPGAVGVGVLSWL